MRPGQNKRMRGSRPNNNTGGGGNRKGPNPLTRSYESNGPDVKIRGNAHHVAEKYLQLARDAQSSGDPVAAESYLQHAEHYFRLIASAQAAQAGYARQPDAVDTEGEDEDDSGIPDRFASPQVVTPFVPQPVATQPSYQAERQPYTGENRQPYNGQNGQGGERQPYNDRQNGDRTQYGDRNAYGRQDRNNPNRRPYRDNAGNEVRTDDRQTGQDRTNQDRSTQDRSNQERSTQERPYQDRQTRRERFAQERQERQERYGNGQEQDRQGQDRSSGDRGFEQPRDNQTSDVGAGEQPRTDIAMERQPEVQAEAYARPTSEPVSRAEPASVQEAQPEMTGRRTDAPRRRERVPVSTTDDAPGLPSFITTPTRVASAPEATSSEPSLTTATAFPGDDTDGAPKFPRRRRRTTRTADDGETPVANADLPVSGD